MGATGDPHDRRPARIVVVDDEPHIVRFLSRLLTSEGYRVAVAYDGEEALQLTESFAPDGMLLDLRLPGMSGEEVLARLRADSRFTDLRIFVLSGCPYAGPQEEPGTARPDVRCAKPIAPSALLRTLREHGVPPLVAPGGPGART